MSELPEIPLHGGMADRGVVRVGQTVHRPPGPCPEYERRLLSFLVDRGFPAPRPLGVDEQGREVLEYLPGEVPPLVGPPLPDAALESAAWLIRRLHDLTEGSELAGALEVVCHTDLGPHNMLFAGDEAVGLIDWDGAGPGERLADLAHAAWSFVPVEAGGPEIAEQARRLELFLNAYGAPERAGEVMGWLEGYFTRSLVAAAASGNEAGVAIFQDLYDWQRRWGPEILACLADED